MAQIIFTAEESEQVFLDAMCNVLGTNYWEGYAIRVITDGEQYKQAERDLSNPAWEDILMQILKNDGHLEVRDDDGYGEVIATIKLKDVHEKVSRAPQWALLEVLEENDDANTADVILQTVFFGEVIYG
jgi:hypothetical protein